MEKAIARSGSGLNPAWRRYQEFRKAWEKAGKPKNFTYQFQDGAGKRILDVKELLENLNERKDPRIALKKKRASLQKQYGKHGKRQ